MSKAYMPLYIGDYMADAGHLTHEEHGVYLLALMRLWTSEKPLPLDLSELAKICRVESYAQMEILWSKISGFFVKTRSGYINKRIKRELLKFSEISKKRSKAALKRHHANAMQMQCKKDANAVQSESGQNQNQIKDKTKRINPLSPFASEDEFEKLWEQYPAKGKVGKKDAYRHYRVSVKTKQDSQSIESALNNYLGSDRVKHGYIQNGSTWFNNWRDWIEKEPVKDAKKYSPATKQSLDVLQNWNPEQ